MTDTIRPIRPGRETVLRDPPSSCRKAFARARGNGAVSIYRVVRAVADASGDEVVDWAAATEAARAATEPGSLDLTDAERAGYADDVREARDRIREVTGVGFDLPDTVEVQHRHHWIDANVETFRRVMRPLADRVGPLPRRSTPGRWPSR